jgi:hypothetical protein
MIIDNDTFPGIPLLQMAEPQHLMSKEWNVSRTHCDPVILTIGTFGRGRDSFYDWPIGLDWGNHASFQWYYSVGMRDKIRGK